MHIIENAISNPAIYAIYCQKKDNLRRLIYYIQLVKTPATLIDSGDVLKKI